MAHTLTLCVFVRPEANFQLDALLFLSKRVDQILIVTTNDSVSEERLSSVPNARLLSVPWHDNFAAARNRGLSSIQTDFVFTVDHNERVEHSTIAAVRELMEDDELANTVHCIRIDVLDAEGETIESTYEPRVWRHRPEIQYGGRVYESFEAPQEIEYAFYDDLRLVQLFEERTHEESAAIEDRNLRLLEQQLSETPNNPHTGYCMGLSLLLQGDYADALNRFEALFSDGVNDDRSRSALVFAVECLRRLGRARDGYNLGLQWANACSDYGEFWFFLGRAALESDQRIRAEAAFRQAKRVPTIATPLLYRDPTVAAYRADVGQAQALASLREAEQAEKVLNSLRERLPPGKLQDVDEDFIQIWLQLNQPKRAWDIVEFWLARAPTWASASMVSIVEYVFNAQGPHAGYSLYQQSIAAHENLLQHLPVVIVGVALAELADDVDSQLDLLRLCIDLGSQDPIHYRSLTRLLVERGDLDAAREIADLERKLPKDDGET